MSPEEKNEVQKMIDSALTKAMGFATRKYGDTPSDDNQLTPRGYVQQYVSVFSASSVSGGGTPGGSDTQIQFNDSGVFGGSSILTFDNNAGGTLHLQASSGISSVTGGTVEINAGHAPPSADGGEIRIGGGNGDAGGSVQIGSGAGNVNDGGGLYLFSGQGGVSGIGGAVSLSAGYGGTTSGTGGTVEIVAGDAQSSVATGGRILIQSGNGQDGDAGFIDIYSGASASGGGSGGNITLQGGSGDFGANIALQGGFGNDTGGFIVLKPGNSATTGGRGTILTIPPGGSTFSSRALGNTTTTDGNYKSVDDLVSGLGTAAAGLLRARVCGRRTGGSAGTAGDIIVTEIVQGLKIVGGVWSLVGSLEFIFFYGDNASADAKFLISGSTAVLQVKGATNNNYSWTYEFWYTFV